MWVDVLMLVGLIRMLVPAPGGGEPQPRPGERGGRRGVGERVLTLADLFRRWCSRQVVESRSRDQESEEGGAVWVSVC